MEGSLTDDGLHRAALDALFRFAPIGLALLDADKRYVRVNDHLAGMNGVPASEHIGRTPRDVIPEVGAAVEAALDHVLETKLPLLGLEMEPPTLGVETDGGRARVSVYPLVHEDRAVGVLGLVTPIGATGPE